MYIYIYIYCSTAYIVCIVCLCGALDGKANHVKGRKLEISAARVVLKKGGLPEYSPRANDNGHPLLVGGLEHDLYFPMYWE